MLVLHH